jgi:hypothetical protein
VNSIAVDSLRIAEGGIGFLASLLAVADELKPQPGAPWTGSAL